MYVNLSFGIDRIVALLLHRVLATKTTKKNWKKKNNTHLQYALDESYLYQSGNRDLSLMASICGHRTFVDSHKNEWNLIDYWLASRIYLANSKKKF